MSPNDPPEKSDADDGEHHRVIAEHGLARSVRDDVRHHPHRRNDEDVHLRVPEIPEQVLPQNRLAAVGKVEEVGANGLVEEQHDCRTRKNRDGEQHEDGGDEKRPNRERQPEPRHAGSTEVHDGRDVVGRAQNRCQAENGDTQQPDLLSAINAGPFGIGTEWRVYGPPGGGMPTFHEESRHHQDSGGKRNPERRHIEPRKRHVGRADLQRDQIIPEHPNEQRHDGKEHHDRPVHRDQGVVKLRQQDPARRHGFRKQLATRKGPIRKTELPADHHRHHPTEQQKHEAHQQKLNTDDLVIGREDVLAQERLLVGFHVRSGFQRNRGSRHCYSLDGSVR